MHMIVHETAIHPMGYTLYFYRSRDVKETWSFFFTLIIPQFVFCFLQNVSTAKPLNFINKFFWYMYVSDDIYPLFILTYYYIEGVYIITYILKEFIDRNS